MGWVMGKHAAGAENPQDSARIARHRAEDVSGPLNTGQVSRASSKKRRIAQIVVATGAMALVTASASPSVQIGPKHVSDKVEPEEAPIKASPGAHVAFEKPSVSTVSAPKPAIPEQSAVRPSPETKEPPKTVKKAEVPSVPAPKPALPTAKVSPVPAKPVVPPKAIIVVPPPASAYVNGALIAGAALAQLGRRQDCTRLVTNSLASAGIAHHGWPVSYLALGDRITDPKDALPGDLIYYVNGGMGLAHIAVYIGNGMAVHGGWNGNQTVTFKANVGSGPVFVRVRAQ